MLSPTALHRWWDFRFPCLSLKTTANGGNKLRRRTTPDLYWKCARHLRGRRVLSVITLWTASYGPIIYRAFCFHDQFCGNPEIGGSVSECCPSLCYFCNISLTVILLTWHKLSSNSVVFELWYESLKCVHSYELFWRKFNIKIATINIIGLLCHFIVFLYISCTGEADKSSARTEKKQPNVSVRMAQISFGALPCRKKKNLMTARVSMLLKSRAWPDMLPFNLCNKKRLAIRHMNRPLFPTTLSIPFHDIGKYVGLRTYQHPLV